VDTMLPPEITATCSETSLDDRRWTVKTEIDPESGDVILPLPDEVVRSLGAELGDVLMWIDLGNGSWQLKKKPHTVLTRCTRYLTLAYNKLRRRT